MYNVIDRTSRFADQQKVLDEERAIAKADVVTRVNKKSSKEQYHKREGTRATHREPTGTGSELYNSAGRSNQREELPADSENEVDERPLAASAFRAWQRTDNEQTSPLEQNVGAGYQRQVANAGRYLPVSERNPTSHQTKGKVRDSYNIL